MTDMDAFLEEQDPADWETGTERAQLLARVAELEAQVERQHTDEARSVELEAATNTQRTDEHRVRAEAELRRVNDELRRALDERDADRTEVVELEKELESTEAEVAAAVQAHETAVRELTRERDAALAAVAKLQRQLTKANAQRDEASARVAKLTPDAVEAQAGGMSERDLARALCALQAEWKRRASARLARRTA
jgi:chromosome segregation ATPase